MTATLTVIVTLLGLLVGGGGVAVWFKIGPERKKLVVDVAQIAVEIHSQVLKDVQGQLKNVTSELALMRMELSGSLEREEACRGRLLELESKVQSLQREFALSRRKAHAAIHWLGNYELHVDGLLDEMRDNNMLIKPEYRTTKLREAFQAEMEQVESLEREIVTDDVRSTIVSH